MKTTMWLLMLISINGVTFAQNEIKLKEFDTPPVLQPYKWIKGAPVHEFEKGKVYVVEFGATWCKPCAALIPTLSEISSKYKDVTVISNYVMEYIGKDDTSASPKYVSEVEKYINKHGDRINYTVAVDDRQKTIETTWLKAADKAGIPDVFIIDRDGKIAWIGNNGDALKKVLAFVRGASYDIEKLRVAYNDNKNAQTKYDATKLLLIGDNGGADTSFLFRSVLAKYKGDIAANGPRFISTLFSDPWVNLRGVIQCTGIGLRALYKLAYSDTLYSGPLDRNQVTNLFNDTADARFKRSYGKYWYYPVLEVKDSTLFLSDFKSPDNRFNYSLKIPEDKASAAFIQECMKADLKRYFGYSVVVEKRNMPCWKIVATDKTRKDLKTKTPGSSYQVAEDEHGNYVITNAEVRDIIAELELGYGYSTSDAMIPKPNKQPPFIDATGIKGEIDFFRSRDIVEQIKSADPSVDTFNLYREMLKENGLELVKSIQTMNVVVIRD